MMDLKTPLGPTSPGILVGFSILLIVPALMIPASIYLRTSIARWLNIAFGIIYAIISILIIIADSGNRWMTFFVLYQVVELVIFGLIIRDAWKWTPETDMGNNSGL